MVSVPTGPESRVFAGRRARWWRRVRCGKGFRIIDAEGRTLTDDKAKRRVDELKIPPAWEPVRINPQPRGRLQVVGLDAQHRPQYIYHASYVARQQQKKFRKIERFGEQLPTLRQATNKDLVGHQLNRQRVLALVLRLVNRMYFRPGSEIGARANHTYGITTLSKRHVRVGPGNRITFHFKGKSNVEQRHVLTDPTITRLVRQLKKRGTSRLFEWFDDDGTAHPVRNQDVNEYLKSIVGDEYSIKDFRTWHGTLLVAQELARLGPGTSKTDTKRKLAAAVKAAAGRLGNTPAVCRKAYLHPLVVYLFEQGFTLVDVPLDERVVEAHQEGHRPEELQLLELFVVARDLQHYQRTKARSKRAKPAAAAGHAAPLVARLEEPLAA